LYEEDGGANKLSKRRNGDVKELFARLLDLDKSGAFVFDDPRTRAVVAVGAMREEFRNVSCGRKDGNLMSNNTCRNLHSSP